MSQPQHPGVLRTQQVRRSPQGAVRDAICLNDPLCLLTGRRWNHHMAGSAWLFPVGLILKIFCAATVPSARRMPTVRRTHRDIHGNVVSTVYPSRTAPFLGEGNSAKP